MATHRETTLRPGTRPEDRRILSAVTATTSAPSLASDGFLLPDVSALSLYFRVEGTDPVFYLQVWYYSLVTESWHKSTQLSVSDNDMYVETLYGYHRIAVQVVGVTGTGATLSAWGSTVRSTP